MGVCTFQKFCPLLATLLRQGIMTTLCPRDYPIHCTRAGVGKQLDRRKYVDMQKKSTYSHSSGVLLQSLTGEASPRADSYYVLGLQVEICVARPTSTEVDQDAGGRGRHLRGLWCRAPACLSL